MAPILSGTILRLDDRRIHGQILYGWGVGWPADEIWLVDEAVIADARERGLYNNLLAESGAIGGVLDPEQAPKRLATLQRELPRARRLVVVSRPDTMISLLGGGIQVSEVNLAHRAKGEGREEIFPRVHLSKVESVQIKALSVKGISMVKRDLPGDIPIPIWEIEAAEGGRS